jgi:hypothetical protein
MSRLLWLGAASFAILAAACAASDSASTEAASASAPTSTAAGPSSTQPATYSDEQLRAYLAARAEIAPIQAGYGALGAEQQAQARTQIAAIVERHGLTAASYDAIARQAQSDPAFASRLTALQPDTFSDANLRAFAAASTEIEPINRTLATATPEQRASAAEQIRGILQRHNLEGATYNAIAARAQSDPAFAARIRALHESAG